MHYILYFPEEVRRRIIIDLIADWLALVMLADRHTRAAFCPLFVWWGFAKPLVGIQGVHKE
jgi:hypothetical protein